MMMRSREIAHHPYFAAKIYFFSEITRNSSKKFIFNH